MKVLLYLLILLACGNKMRPSSSPEQQPVLTDTLYRMDILHPMVMQSLESIDQDPASIHFVEIEVTHVVNPKEYPASFTVHYHAKGGEAVLLGHFSLFPATNPGTFIVSARGLLSRTGMIELRLERPDNFEEEDVLSVTVKPMRFLQQ